MTLAAASGVIPELNVTLGRCAEVSWEDTGRLRRGRRAVAVALVEVELGRSGLSALLDLVSGTL